HPYQLDLLTTYTTKQAMVSSNHISSISARFTHNLHHQTGHGQQQSHLIHISSIYSHPTPPIRPWSAAVISHLYQLDLLTSYTTNQAVVSSSHLSSISA